MTRLLAVVVALPTLLAAQSSHDAVVEARRTVTLQAAVAGQVAELPVSVGQRVQRDDVVCVLVDARLEAAAARADAEVGVAESRLVAAQLAVKISSLQLTISQRAVKVAAERLPTARERLQAATEHLESVTTLFETGRAGQDMVLQARVEHAGAQELWSSLGAEAKAAQEREAIARLEHGRAEAALQGAEAQLHAARAAAQLARLDVAALAVRAPFAGVVTAVHLSEGAQARPRQTALLTLADDSVVRMRLQLSAPHSRTIAVGQAARVAVADGEAVEGRVAVVAPLVAPDTGRREASLEFDNSEHAFLLGEHRTVLLAGR